MKKYILAAEYSKRNNYISRRLSYDDNEVTISSQSANFTHFDRVDINIIAPVQLSDFWDVQFFGRLNYKSYPISRVGAEQILSRWASTFSVQKQLKLYPGPVPQIHRCGITGSLSH